MNRILPYEELLADKVLQAPVPDMADSIWAVIEQELDKGLPGSPGEEAPPAPKGGPALPRLYWYAAGCVVIAVISIIYYFTHQKRSRPQPVTPVQQERGTEQHQNSPQGDSILHSTTSFPIPDREPGRLSAPAVDSIPSGNSVEDDPPAGENSNGPDSSLNGVLPPVTMTPGPVSQDTVPAKTSQGGKKPRGMKGLTDDDYKIRAAKKDSAK